ncbi:MAG: substrate-binding domain-containing protein [Planctomycetaceae bacterium]|nr:substrate-binding domain-containing protein [Planctomycetaceae bacterium]
MSTIRQVALLMRINKDYDRQIIAGVSQYAGQNDWSVYLQDEPHERVPKQSQWLGDGIIADLDDPETTRIVGRAGVPAVGIGGYSYPAQLPFEIPYVATDDVANGRLGAEHLVNCGLRHFAFCGLPATPYNSWARHRERAFVDALREAGYNCAVYRGRHRSARNWESMQRGLLDWLDGQETPLGIMCCDDPRARHVVEACRRSGRRIPEDVAVLGVDNDLLMCELCNPPLSSIQHGAVEIGLRAAEVLDRLMSGQTDMPQWSVVPPKGVVQRRSTDVMNSPHPTVTEALRFIRENAGVPISVSQVARHVAVSRSTLDREFRRCLGHTTHEEIERVRLDVAKRLLTGTDQPLRVIARQAGYSNEQYFSFVFRNAFHVTPGQYRAGNDLGRSRKRT